MSDTATDLTPPPEPEAVAPPEQQAAPEPQLNIDDDAAVDQALDNAAIDLPDGDKLVAKSQAGQIASSYRGKIKELKAELEQTRTTAQRATQLESQIAQLQQQVQQLTPYAQAFQAHQQAAQQPQQNAQEDAEAEEYAKVLDLYQPDGKPDIARAKKALAAIDRLATRKAEATVAPIQQTQVQERAAYNLARAKNTELAGGVKADPAILDLVWRQLDPALTATPEGAKQAFIAALGYSHLTKAASPAQPAAQPGQPQRAPNGRFQPQQPSQPVGDPLFTEKAGGRDTPADQPLSAHELSYIKAAGITEKDYRESAKNAPWLNRR